MVLLRHTSAQRPSNSRTLLRRLTVTVTVTVRFLVLTVLLVLLVLFLLNRGIRRRSSLRWAGECCAGIDLWLGI